jgi:CHAT domain-containing protein/predicted negative regulator of RcsB-dependent stress response
VSLPHWTTASQTAASASIAPPIATSQSTSPSSLAQSTGTPTLDQGRSLYEAGQYTAAADVLEQAIAQYRNQGDRLAEAVALSNLSLVYQRMGQWQSAETAIQTGLDILQTDHLPNSASVLAQAYDIQGRLDLSQGQAEQALTSWEQAEDIYQALADQPGLVRNGINQAEALQTLGLYRRATDTLTKLTQSLQGQPDSLEHLVALRSLGDALRVTGELRSSQEILQATVAMGERLQASSDDRRLPEAIATTQFSLGNTLYALGQTESALAAYTAAIATGTDTIQVQAQLNQFRVYLESNQLSTAQRLIPLIAVQLDRLPPSRSAIFAQINFAKSLMQLPTGTPHPQVAQLLAVARQHAKQLQDGRSEAFALGNLGELYEQTNQLAEAQQLTEEALLLSQQIHATDMIYLWQWQNGRIFAGKGDRNQAIASYKDAVTSLQSIRTDLVAISPEVQFSFRDSVEPIHRELVSLLLQPNIEPTQVELEEARKTIESLQLAELDNFFREACLNAREIQIDEVDRLAAVFYPIILDDRLEVIFSLPQASGANPLKRHTTPLQREQVEQTASNLLSFLRQVSANQRALPLAQQLYTWLIEPFTEELQTSNVKTLVFVLDGVLRNIPMAVLYDGEQYLVEKYSIALTPSLQLLESQPLQPQQLSVLLGGVSEARQEFPALPGVVKEFEEIRATVTSNEILLNQEFSGTSLQEAINAVSSPVVHLATHGQFSSRLEDTFILTWDDRININQLSSLLQTSDISRRRPIELLVLSACTTATGDDRAALGLAGVAVRAGARSTVATLWQLNDEAAPLLMQRFYQELTSTKVTKAEALRQAQLTLLENPQFRRPYFWSPMVLVGNWL